MNQVNTELPEVVDQRILAGWQLSEWADRILEYAGVGVTRSIARAAASITTGGPRTTSIASPPISGTRSTTATIAPLPIRASMPC